MERIGVFGGAFDPPHREHLAIALAAIRQLDLDILRIVPTYSAPHKTTVTPFELRVEMLHTLFDGIDSVVIDEVESTLGGKSYTANTLEYMSKAFPKADIYCIIGGDSLLQLDGWYQPQRILEYGLYVVSRGEYVLPQVRERAAQLNAEGHRITVSDYVADDRVSSSLIRCEVELEGNTLALTGEGVADIISQNKLYRKYRDIVDKFLSCHSERLIRHSFGVAREALYIARNHYLSFDKVFLSGLLHDNMKESDYIYDGVPLDAIGSPVLHAFNGALSLAPEYGIGNREIFDAVYYHTTGRAEMSLLEKLIYVADITEPNRSYEGVDDIRAIVYQDLEKGFLKALEHCYFYLLRQNRDMYYLTKDCFNYYIKEQK